MHRDTYVSNGPAMSSGATLIDDDIRTGRRAFNPGWSTTRSALEEEGGVEYRFGHIIVTIA